MADVRGFLADHKLGVTLVTASLVVLGGVAVASSPDAGATVAAIVDGDTIDVVVDGEEQRVRLLNVDTPEVGECLHDEATTFLEQRIPPGTEVDLEYDEERHDQYGRVLAGVLENDSLVNAEIAAEGLGVAVLFEPNDRFYDEVLAAQAAAEDAGLGLFSTAVACTLPAQVHEYAEQAEQLAAAVGTGSHEEIDGWAAEAATVAAVGAALHELLDGDGTVLPLLAYTGDRWTLREDVTAADAQVTEAEAAIATAREAEEQRIQEEQERREREEAERREREEAEQREREEAERREREEAEQRERQEAERREAERREAEEAAAQERRESSGSSGSGSSGGGSVYYKNCTAARAAGAAPVLAGDPGYARHLDRDGDGIGCE